MSQPTLHPEVSFVVIAYNEENHLERTIRAIMGQTNLGSHELIVINDGSTDATASIARRLAKEFPTINFIDFAQNQGRGAGRAAGVQAARGTFIAFVDGDITLPPHWLDTCRQAMATTGADAVGGTAIPDGDASYLYKRFGLTPKLVAHSTAVTGSNGLFHRDLFNNVHYDPALRDGEDVAFNHALTAQHAKLHSVRGLSVAHEEDKSWAKSLSWLYQSGRGATRQLKTYREIRLPDLAFAGFLGLLLAGIVASLWLQTAWPVVPAVLYPLLTSALHVWTKFSWQASHAAKWLGAVLINYPLILAYYLGRIVGLAIPAPHKDAPELVNVCFDFEGEWGMDHKAPYDQMATTQNLLDVLKRHNVQATFFIVGALIEKYPDVVKAIAAAGHEIGIHGYEHERLNRLTAAQLAEMDTHFTRFENRLDELTGQRPTGFRAPYLMAPDFYVPAIYSMLQRHGYQWVSNREIRYPEELFHPRRLGFLRWLLGSPQRQNIGPLSRLMLIAINYNLFTKPTRGSFMRTLRWLTGTKAPYQSHGLMEVPVYSPLDCDLIGLPTPQEASSPALLRYFVESLSDGASRPGSYYTVNVHDWIMGSNNRLAAFDELLGRLAARGLRFGLISEHLKLPTGHTKL